MAPARYEFCHALAVSEIRNGDAEAIKGAAHSKLNSCMEMRTTISVVFLFHSLSIGCSAILEDDDVIGGGPHFDLFDFPFADPVTWAAAAESSASGNTSNGLGGFQGEKSRL